MLKQPQEQTNTDHRLSANSHKHSPTPVSFVGGMVAPRKADPCVMVIFGAGGDLTKRLLIPSLYNLAHNGLLPEPFAVVGVTREPVTDEQFREQMNNAIKSFATEDVRPELWESIDKRCYCTSGRFEDPKTYEKLRTVLANVDKEQGTCCNYLFYCATPPDYFSVIAKQLGAAGLVEETPDYWRRVVIEKPFGRDLDSAVALNRDLAEVLHETQIYRIDHYLGKETVQNILVFRFANGIFEPVWNRRYVEQVQITVAESIGVEGRGNYYDRSGALRDMVQNHLFQMLALVAMEPPSRLAAEALRNEKTKVLQAIQPIDPEQVLTSAVRGQYGSGRVNGQPVPAYRNEPNVNPESSTETFVALKLMIDNWRWADVPFYLRTGKRLPQRVTEIAIQFRRAPSLLFRNTPAEHITPNLLVLRIQPDEGISLQFGAKVPGPQVDVGSVDMEFAYSDYFGASPSTGYETLLYDCMIGDAMLFQRADNVEAGWKVVMPILDVWQALPARSFPNHVPGTWGPHEADELLARDGRFWRAIRGAD